LLLLTDIDTGNIDTTLIQVTSSIYMFLSPIGKMNNCQTEGLKNNDEYIMIKNNTLHVIVIIIRGRRGCDRWIYSYLRNHCLSPLKL
jgi:hypothetical protein